MALAGPVPASAPARRGRGPVGRSRSRSRRIVVAPTNEATLGEMPRDPPGTEASSRVVQWMSYLMSPWPRSRLRLHLVGERAERGTLAEDLEGDALADIALGPAVVQQRHGRPAQHVDEPGRHRQPARHRFPSCPAWLTSSDRDDAVALDGQVPGVGTIRCRRRWCRSGSRRRRRAGAGMEADTARGRRSSRRFMEIEGLRDWGIGGLLIGD